MHVQRERGGGSPSDPSCCHIYLEKEFTKVKNTKTEEFAQYSMHCWRHVKRETVATVMCHTKVDNTKTVTNRTAQLIWIYVDVVQNTGHNSIQKSFPIHKIMTQHKFSKMWIQYTCSKNISLIPSQICIAEWKEVFRNYGLIKKKY